MKKYIVAAVIVCQVFVQSVSACTTFLINNNGQLVFGRNYDWLSDAGMVCTNLKGLYKTSVEAEDGNTISWVSKYGSMTFNQYGKEFPTGGMNEQGLVVELMWNDGTEYPKKDARPAIGVLQWLQYQLDNNATVDEVIATDKKVRISANNPPLHYLVADADGNAATIEFFDGKAVIHQGKDLPYPVLTNSSYTLSAKTATEANVASGNTAFAFQDNSLQRFTKACSMLQLYQLDQNKEPVVEYAFNVLDKVSSGDFTKWSIVYDLKNKKVYFRTERFKDVKSFAFASFNFTCGSESKVADMNQPLKGDIGKNFVPFSTSINRRIVETAVEESKSQVPISDKTKEASIAYAGSIKCKE